VKITYNWRKTAERTEKVYNYAINQNQINIYNKIKLLFARGPVVGMYAILFMIYESIVIALLDIFWPS